uniref:Uncharacterized protein n=1 Tax=Acrobeloides nanus TaxID=290746 RepID=A0A914C221_9BILA
MEDFNMDEEFKALGIETRRDCSKSLVLQVADAIRRRNSRQHKMNHLPCLPSYIDLCEAAEGKAEKSEEESEIEFDAFGRRKLPNWELLAKKEELPCMSTNKILQNQKLNTSEFTHTDLTDLDFTKIEIQNPPSVNDIATAYARAMAKEFGNQNTATEETGSDHTLKVGGMKSVETAQSDNMSEISSNASREFVEFNRLRRMDPAIPTAYLENILAEIKEEEGCNFTDYF